nr:hypothetical protein [Micromonospora sp. DSM 115978]
LDGALEVADGRSLAPLLRSSSALVRLGALDGEAAAGRGREAALFLLADDARPVRQHAQFVLRRVGGLGQRPSGQRPSGQGHADERASDLAEFYRQRLRQGVLAPGVLAGLAETGTTEDAPLLAAHVTVGAPRLRAAAVAGLHRLGRLPAGT